MFPKLQGKAAGTIVGQQGKANGGTVPTNTLSNRVVRIRNESIMLNKENSHNVFLFG